MKKLLLALCVMLALLVSVAAAENTGLEAGEYRSDKEEYKDIAPMQAGNYWYIELKDGTAEIVKYTGSDKELMIPAKLDGISVSSLGALAFSYCNTINNVTIPDSVKHIGVGTFYCCESMTSVTIPDSVIFIGECAFMECFSLTSITLPVSLPKGLNHTFCSCTSLNSVVLPADISFIGPYTFARCYALTSLVIPDSVTFIDETAFEESPNLTLCVTPFSAAEKHAQKFHIPYVYAPVTEGWTCPNCLNYNETDFCTECGTAKPAPTPTPAPVSDGSWDCTCGSHNTGKFCGKCGTKRPDLTICPSCGHQSEDTANNFCTECGAQF